MDNVAAKELSQVFLNKVHAIPDGEKIDQCLQCGTCSASCPTSEVMDYSPREIIAALRAGMLGRVLETNTVWLCTSCYSCSVRCPAGIPFTDVMYELKRLGIKHGVHPKGSTNAVMAQAFTEAVDRYGRNFEPEIIRRYYLRTKPLKIFSQAGLGWRLFRRGRMALLPDRIRDVAGLRKMMSHIEENGTS